MLRVFLSNWRAVFCFKNFTPAEQLIKDREQEQFNMERQVWEQHCERLHQEVANLTTLCNGLLRDQQMLVSTVISRNVTSGPSPSSAGFQNISSSGSVLGKLFLTVVIIERFHMTSRYHSDHISVPKRWNGDDVGVPNLSYASWTLFFFFFAMNLHRCRPQEGKRPVFSHKSKFTRSKGKWDNHLFSWWLLFRKVHS